MKLNKFRINTINPNTYSFEQIDVKNIEMGNDRFYFVFENENNFSGDFLNSLCLDKILSDGFDVFIYCFDVNYKKTKKIFDDFLKERGLK